MTVRYSKKLSQLLVLSLGLCVATTAFTKPNEDSSSTGEDSSSTGEDSSSRKPNKKQRRATAYVEPEDSGMPLSLALLGSFGVNSEYTRGGIGLRGGLHLEGSLPLYFGGIATYFFGHKTPGQAAFGEAGSSVDRGFMYLGAEAGVDLTVMKDVTLRPYLGLGLGRSSEEICGGNGTCESKAAYPLTITPAVVGLYDLGAGVFVGGDIRFLIAAGADDVSGPILSATLGFKF